jgi:hypothetical protein
MSQPQPSASVFPDLTIFFLIIPRSVRLDARCHCCVPLVEAVLGWTVRPEGSGLAFLPLSPPALVCVPRRIL